MGASIPARRSSMPSSTSATHRPSAPAAIAVERDVDRSVAVTVGLHDGPQRRRGDPLAQDTGRCGRPHRDRSRPRPNGSTDAHRSAPIACGIRSTMSPASSPCSGPRRAAAPWSQAARGGRERRFGSGGECGADQPGEHVTRASGGEALISSIDEQDPPAGRCDDRGRALEEHRRVELGHRSARRCDPIVAGAFTGEEAELAVVRGEHRREFALAEQRSGAVAAPRRGEQGVAVDHHGHGRLADALASSGERVVLATETRADDERSEASDVGQRFRAEPAGRDRRAARSRCGCSGRQPGAESDTSPLPPRAAAAVQSSAAPGMPELPAITFTAACHLWASTARDGHHRATSDASTRWHAMWSVSRPMSTICDLA